MRFKLEWRHTIIILGLVAPLATRAISAQSECSDLTKLGYMLFSDRSLSRDRSISCASCHQPALAYADSSRFSRGVDGQLAERNTPSLLNLKAASAFSWDGRERSIDRQVLRPIYEPRELGLTQAELVWRIRSQSKYKKQFDALFVDGVNEGNIAQALAAFVLGLNSDNLVGRRRLSPSKTVAHRPQASRGQRLFTGKARCAKCHSGQYLSDGEFHDIGVSPEMRDRGRFTVTLDSTDMGAFRTPSLNGVAKSAPYMHDGSLPTLTSVVDFYLTSSQLKRGADLSMKGLSLTAEERADLVAFLESLSVDGVNGACR